MLSTEYYFIMGIIDRLYDGWHNVECHYNVNCTYERVRETSSIRYWIRKCVCRRKLSEKELKHHLNTDLRRETKHGSGGPWYELSWTEYDEPDFSNSAR